MIEGEVVICGDGVITWLVLGSHQEITSQNADETIRQVSQDFRGNSPSDPAKAIPRGCLLSLGSALITCLMLFINGSLVLAFLAVFARFGPTWIRDPRFSQFMLFLLPVLLVVAEWMMIDYVRSRFQQDIES